jgi:AAA domain
LPGTSWASASLFFHVLILWIKISLIGDGGVGKTALRYLQYLSLATGRAFTGEHVFQRCRVLVVCLEDDRDEVRRRIRAAMLHYDISAEELKGWLFLWTPSKGDKLMEEGPDGELMPGRLASQLPEVVTQYQIDVVGIDPFIKAHAVDENSNTKIDQVCALLAEIASDHNCAIDILHHTRKGALEPGNADTGRGASAVKDAARLVRTLMRMAPYEAELFNLKPEQSAQLVRLDNAKTNLTAPAPQAKWFRLVGVELGNGTNLYPHGDEVQTVKPWTPPDLFKGLSSIILNTILTEIDRGLDGGELYSDHGKATDRAAWRVVTKHTGRTEAEAKQIIRVWIRNSVLYRDTYYDEDERKNRQGLRVRDANRPT